MARIRSIKPSFFTSMSVHKLSLQARLTFIGLWTHCDDEGRCMDEPRLIKAAIWPLDDSVNVKKMEAIITELVKAGKVQRYAVDGSKYLSVRGFDDHQKIDRKGKSNFPPPTAPSDQRKDDEDSSNDRRKLGEGSLPEGKGKEGSGKERNGTERKGAAAAADSDDDGAPTVRDAFVEPHHRDAFDCYRRSHRNPDAFARDIELMHSGEHGPGGKPVSIAIIGRALCEMQSAGAPYSSQVLRKFIIPLQTQAEPDTLSSPDEVQRDRCIEYARKGDPRYQAKCDEKGWLWRDVA